MGLQFGPEAASYLKVVFAQRQIPYGPRLQKCSFSPKSVSLRRPYLGATGSFGPNSFFPRPWELSGDDGA